MTTGDVVGTLIYLRDNHDLLDREDDAICAACNILNKVPTNTDVEDLKELLKQIEHTRA